MKLRIVFLTCVALCVLSLNVSAYNPFESYPNDKPVQPIEGEIWPQAIVDAINAHSRVYGFGADGGGTFSFTGKTRDVNAFLQQTAQDKASELKVVLSPEAGSVTPDISDNEHRDFKSDCNWSVDLHYNHDPYDSTPDKEKLPDFTATVTIHCVGSIDPAALKIPLRFQASVGGRLADFANLHNAKRDDLIKQSASLDTPPSTLQSLFDNRPQSFFGSATEPATIPAK